MTQVSPRPSFNLLPHFPSLLSVRAWGFSSLGCKDGPASLSLWFEFLPPWYVGILVDVVCLLLSVFQRFNKIGFLPVCPPPQWIYTCYYLYLLLFTLVTILSVGMWKSRKEMKYMCSVCSLEPEHSRKQYLLSHGLKCSCVLHGAITLFKMLCCLINFVTTL